MHPSCPVDSQAANPRSRKSSPRNRIDELPATTSQKLALTTRLDRSACCNETGDGNNGTRDTVCRHQLLTRLFHKQPQALIELGPVCNPEKLQTFDRADDA